MKNIKYDIKNIKFVMGKEYPFRMQSNSINYQLKIDCDIIIYINIYMLCINFVVTTNQKSTIDTE